MKHFCVAILASCCYIPYAAEASVVKAPETLPSVPAKASSKININDVKADALVGVVHGIGPKRAEAIVKYRAIHGRFKSIDGLGDVRGVGHAFVTKHRQALQDHFKVD